MKALDDYIAFDLEFNQYEGGLPDHPGICRAFYGR